MEKRTERWIYQQDRVAKTGIVLVAVLALGSIPVRETFPHPLSFVLAGAYLAGTALVTRWVWKRLGRFYAVDRDCN